MKYHRLLSVDVMRGLAIATILVIHRIHYQWTGMQTHEMLKENLHSPWAPLIILTIAMFTMAGMFYFISGLVNAYSIYNRVSQNTCSRKKWMYGGVLSGIILIIFNYFHRILFMNGFNQTPGSEVPEFPAGFITGWLRNSNHVSFHWSQVTEPGTLSLIGLLVIILTLVFAFMFNKRQFIKPENAKTVLSILTVLFLIATPFIKFWLRPIYEYAYLQGHYLRAICLGHVCQEFSLFPYMGYGFFGAMLGLSLAMKEERTRFIRRTNLWVIFLTLAGIAGLVLFDRNDLLGKRIMGASISYIELAIFTLMLNALLRYIDFTKKNFYELRKNKTQGIRQLGMIALTIYFFEPVIAEIVRKSIDLMTGDPTWVNEFYWVLIFGFGCLILWWIIIRFWSLVSYKGSLEWFTAFLIFRLAGKESTKVDFESLRPEMESLERSTV